MKVFYDLHIHSCLSPCGSNDMTPNNIVNMAKLAGLNIIALTDHNSAKNCPAIIKAGQNANIIVIPGMEVCTSEEIHVLCLFYDISSALAMDDFIFSKTPDIKNNSSIFGDQIIMDSNDNIIANEEKLLINAADISIDNISEIAGSFGGITIPAHINKNSYSILSAFGYIPPECDFPSYEITSKGDAVNLTKNYSVLQNKPLLLNSDAHYLEHISEPKAYFDLPECSAKAILDAASGKIKCDWSRG